MPRKPLYIPEPDTDEDDIDDFTEEEYEAYEELMSGYEELDEYLNDILDYDDEDFYSGDNK